MIADAAPHRPVPGLVRFGVLLAVLLIAIAPLPAHAAGPDDVLVSRDLQYGTDQSEELVLDAYQPSAASSPAPILIIIHGGGWVQGDKAEYEPFARALAAVGFVVFDINYSLDLSRSPAYPREVRDAQTALAWVQKHAGQFNGDTSRIGVAGGSAGGYLAAMLGNQANSSDSRTVRAVVSLSGPMDLISLTADLRQAATSTPDGCAPANCAAIELATTRLRGLLGCDPLQCSEQILREASPITYVTPASPPFFLANSTDEIVPASQSSNMATALRSRNVPVELHLVPGTKHAVAYVPTIRSSLLDFLTKYVAGSPPTQSSATPRSHGIHWAAVLRWVLLAVLVALLVAVFALRRRASAIDRAPLDDPLDPTPRK